MNASPKTTVVTAPTLPDLNVGSLRAFCAVAETGSFSRAAAALGYSQPTVSQRVAELETRLGQALIDRTTRPVRLTGVGRRVRRASLDVIARTDALHQAANDPPEHLDRVRIASFPTATASLLPPAIRAARVHVEHLEVTVQDHEPYAAIDAVVHGAVDLAVVHDYPETAELALSEELEVIELLREGFRWILPLDGPYDAPGQHLTDLRDTVWIGTQEPGPAASFNVMLQEVAARSGVAPEIVPTTNDTVVAQALVAAGMGVLLLPELALRNQHPFVRSARVDGCDPTRRIAAVRLRARGLTPAAEAVLSGLQLGGRGD